MQPIDPAIDSSVLVAKDGAVAICDTSVSGPDAVVERFATITDAESYLAVSASIDPDKLSSGIYSIDAPHGLGSDGDAEQLARAYGFDVFYSMGNAYYTKGNHYGTEPATWSRGYAKAEAAALAALATVDPEEVYQSHVKARAAPTLNMTPEALQASTLGALGKLQALYCYARAAGSPRLAEAAERASRELDRFIAYTEGPGEAKPLPWTAPPP